MTFNETKVRKIAKILLIVCAGLAFFSFLLLTQQVRDLIIAIIEKIVGHNLVHDEWHDKIWIWEFTFLKILAVVFFLFSHFAFSSDFYKSVKEFLKSRKKLACINIRRGGGIFIMCKFCNSFRSTFFLH